MKRLLALFLSLSLISAQADTLINPTIVGGSISSSTKINATVASNGIKSATTVVDCSASAAPTAGQIPTANSSTSCSWLTPSSGGGLNVKAPPYNAVGDGVTNNTTAIANAITAAAGGLVIFPGTATSYVGTLPSVYTAQLEYMGARTAINLYAESGETTRFSKRVLRSQGAGPHVGEERSLYTIEYRPVGSGQTILSDVNSDDTVLTISNIKQNYLTTTVTGQIIGMSIVTRNGGAAGGKSDSGGIVINNAVAGTAGFSAALENQSSLLAATTGVVQKQSQTQMGTIDPNNAIYNGFYASANTSTLTDAFRATNQSGGSWTNFLHYNNTTQDLFNVNSTGQIVLTEAGAPANIKTIRVSVGSLSVVNAANTVELLNLSDTGTLVVGGSTSTINTNTVIFTTLMSGSSKLWGSSSNIALLASFGTAPTSTGNGTLAFQVNVGTGANTGTGTVTFPVTATTGWNCHVNAEVFTANTRTIKTASTTTTVTVTNYTVSTGATAAWPASTILDFICFAL